MLSRNMTFHQNKKSWLFIDLLLLWVARKRFILLMIRLYAGTIGRGEKDLRGLSMLGFILLTVFLIDEIKIEFLRIIQSGYQSIIFTTLGGFLAFSDRARLPSNSSTIEEKSGNDALIVKSSILKEKSPNLLNTIKSKP